MKLKKLNKILENYKVKKLEVSKFKLVWENEEKHNSTLMNTNYKDIEKLLTNQKNNWQIKCSGASLDKLILSHIRK